MIIKFKGRPWKLSHHNLLAYPVIINPQVIINNSRLKSTLVHINELEWMFVLHPREWKVWHSKFCHLACCEIFYIMEDIKPIYDMMIWMWATVSGSAPGEIGQFLYSLLSSFCHQHIRELIWAPGTPDSAHPTDSQITTTMTRTGWLHNTYNAMTQSPQQSNNNE